jgi:hypothetical protein
MDAAMTLWKGFIQQTDAFGSWDGMRASRAATEQNRAFTYKLLTDSLSAWPGAEAAALSFAPWPARRAVFVVARPPVGSPVKLERLLPCPALFTFHSVF